ncbi:MAG: hypothetical protein WBA48_00675 [Xanthobacteraceae bacterium]
MQTTTERPARVAGELYFPTDISPDQVFEAIGRLRKEAQDEIDRLLAFLDETDGYSTTEQEINGDEADASFPEGGARLSTPMEDDEAGGDDEPSLGFQAGDIFVGRGCESGGSGDDRELEDEHDEDNNDREDDPAERGIADLDGLMEQVGNSYGEVL